VEGAGPGGHLVPIRVGFVSVKTYVLGNNRSVHHAPRKLRGPGVHLSLQFAPRAFQDKRRLASSFSKRAFASSISSMKFEVMVFPELVVCDKSHLAVKAKVLQASLAEIVSMVSPD
jgi:hypothetical protein